MTIETIETIATNLERDIRHAAVERCTRKPLSCLAEGIAVHMLWSVPIVYFVLILKSVF